MNGGQALRCGMPTSPFVVAPPIEPMLAKLATELPVGDTFLYEPKWDGFRAIVFCGARELFIQSRDLRPLDRYFPELHDALLDVLPDGCVIDGEIVIATPRGLDFDALQMRLHPAASRVAKLAKETPSAFVAFDAIAADGEDLREVAQSERRRRLERLARARQASGLSDAHDPRSRPGLRVAVAVRGRRPRRRDCQARGRHVPARQARDDQSQTRADRRLRGRRLPLAQGRQERARRLAAARALRREPQAASRRRDLVVHDGDAQAARGGARTAS